jgi:hypothetical protein
MVSGRRSGKSFISSLVATYLACFSNYAKHLNAGERAVILVLARDRDQGRVCFAYIAGIIREIAPLAAMVVSERADEIELDNGTVIMVKTSDFRSVRGLTLAAVICDEVAFWDSQGVSPDTEIFRALKPAMATIPDSKLIAISSPYAMSGVLYEAHRDFFGKNDSNVLVWQSETRVMNPLIEADLIQRELERDPDSAKSEWLATFRDDLEAAFSLDSLRACVIPGRSELPSSSAIAYSGFVDPSGGRHDAFTVAIGHREKDGVVVDVVKAWYPPFDPSVVVREASDILKGYGVASIVGDNYGGEWPVESFKNCGIAYERAEKHKSELYLSLIPTVNAKLVELLDDHKLIEELRRLERRRGRTGKDSIDHPPRLSDDLANSVAGLVHLVLNNEDGGSSGFNARFHISNQPILPAYGEPLFIGLTLTEPVASVIAQGVGGSVQVLAALVSETGGLRHHVEGLLIPWLTQHARFAFSSWQRLLLGSYDDNMDLLTVQTLHASLETIAPWNWQQPSLQWEGRRESMLALLSQVERFTFQPKLQVSNDAVLIAQSLSRPTGCLGPVTLALPRIGVPQIQKDR